jgi:hypothetical protein
MLAIIVDGEPIARDYSPEIEWEFVTGGCIDQDKTGVWHIHCPSGDVGGIFTYRYASCYYIESQLLCRACNKVVPDEIEAIFHLWLT